MKESSTARRGGTRHAAGRQLADPAPEHTGHSLTTSFRHPIDAWRREVDRPDIERGTAGHATLDGPSARACRTGGIALRLHAADRPRED
ncbi:hypothetical protein AAB992_37690 [Burkholderia contaminans]|uniref:hypothetical protein n=1 Tax=Burkholderia contaminans TaxID=488447 RepID=UPI002415F4A0|nr:hypothetical protein [Burkholderia contaminans]WFN14602.1 hypothetical protein LXE92_37575 [Burkholderia contaminans]